MTDATPTPTPTPTPAPTIDYNAVYGTLSPENKEVFDKKNFAKAGKDNGPVDINMVFDWGRSAEKLVGSDHIPSPRLDNDEEFGKWPGWEKLGVPNKPDAYKFDRPQMPEGIPYDEAAETALRVALHKGRVGQKQATAIFNDMVAMRMGEATRVADAAKTERSETEASLRKDFGASYDANLTRAQMALKYAAEKSSVDATAAIDGLAKLAGNAAAIKLLSWLGAQLGEDKIQGGGGAGFANSPAAAKAEIEKLNLDPEFQKAYRKEAHPGHKDAVARMLRLHEQAAAAA